MIRKRLSSLPRGRVTLKKVVGGYNVNIKGKKFDEVATKKSGESAINRIKRLRKEDKRKGGKK